MTNEWHSNCFVTTARGMGEKRNRTKGCTMETYTPEFTAFWLGNPESGGEHHRAEGASGHQGLSPSQQVALEELAERVNAARSVV
jgi:hypothetical protein